MVVLKEQTGEVYCVHLPPDPLLIVCSYIACGTVVGVGTIPLFIAVEVVGGSQWFTIRSAVSVFAMEA